MYFVPMGNIMLALTADEFERAKTRGCEYADTAGDETHSLVDSRGLAEIVNLPQSWLEEAARQGKIPSIMAGKYRRFEPPVAVDALRLVGA